MSISQDPDHFFQTDQSQAETSRKVAKSKNEHGDPIRLKSKILAVIADPTLDGAVYLAESAGQVRRIVLDTGDTKALYRGPTTPLTSLALSPDNTTIYAGSWDKAIWSWSIKSLTPQHRYKGHTDFVKTVLCTRLPNNNTRSSPFDILISGGADSKIIIWNTETGAKLHSLIGHNRGILCLAIDPLSYPESGSQPDHDGKITLFSGSSDREIRRWILSRNMNAPSSGARSTLASEDPPIVAHETSVYGVQFDSDGELWTASADGTAKCLNRERGWEIDTTLEHGDYVRAVALDEERGIVITGGRNEDVKVWDQASGKLVFAYRGHYDEVTGLVVLKGNVVVSVGIDGTIRRWSLKAEDIGRAIKEREDEANGIDKEIEVLEETEGLVTADEERELAEMMEDTDD